MNGKRSGAALIVTLVIGFNPPGARAADPAQRAQAEAAIAKAAAFFRDKVATHGGYVYYYSLDLKRRWGEGEASPDQIWVQPPGTPAVGMTYLKAYEATGNRAYLDAAREAAEALVYGQLASGGWTNSIDFNPRGAGVARYRNGKGGGKDNSTLDDGISQAAIRLLMHVDRALQFKDRKIHESARIALDALLKAQFPNGGFPQVWTGPVSRQPVVKANYPDYDWRTEGKIKDYWTLYTLNDNTTGYVLDALIDAYDIYKDEKYRDALTRLGDFFLLAQMPDPQPAWAQQYNYDMQPVWARRFEPPAIAGRESQDTIEALLKIYRITRDEKYLEPIPRAIAYLRKSLLPDGRLSRYYELKTNKPLYMQAQGGVYTLTFSDANLPAHYGWKWASRLDEFESEYSALKGRGPQPATKPSGADLEPQVKQIIRDLDEQGRWVSTYEGGMIVGQPKFAPKSRYLSSEVFSRNVGILSEYLIATK